VRVTPPVHTVENGQQVPAQSARSDPRSPGPEQHSWDELVALLDAGGYARYDFRTATRLQTLARAVNDRYGGDIAEIGRRFTDPGALLAAFDTLPDWGPATAQR